MAIAPDNVISRVYPEKGNEKAIGLNFLETPTQRGAVLRLMRDLQPVIAGPIELVQGGIGIVNRILIVFTKPGGEPLYWGLASIAIDPCRYSTVRRPAGQLGKRGCATRCVKGTGWARRARLFWAMPRSSTTRKPY